MPLRHAVIVTAAGSSSRFNGSSEANSKKKEYLELGGKSILCRAVEPFLEAEGLAFVLVTYREGDLETVSSLLGNLDIEKNHPKTRLVFVKGGPTRQASVFNALETLYDLSKDCPVDLVSIHDGARPFVSVKLVTDCLKAASETGGACPCIRVSDTLVRVDKDGLLCGRLSREGVCRVQTPQTFCFPDIYFAHCKADPDKAYTDDTEIFMDFGKKVCFVEGDEKNIKITYSQDIKEI